MASENEPLHLATFEVSQIRGSASTRWSQGVLETDLRALEASLAGEIGSETVNLEIVRPGDPVRIMNVLDVVEPTVKVGSVDATFPGILGPTWMCGAGLTYRLEGASVIATADLASTHPDVAEEIPDSIVDMAGPGASLCRWSRTNNIVVSFGCSPGVGFAEVDGSIRRATLRLARDLAATTIDSDADRTDELTLGPVDGSLPGICVILQIAAEGPGEDTYLYGVPATEGMPRTIDPREVLDGAVTAASYDWPGVRNPTFSYQRSELLLRLLEAHGRNLRFAGVVLTLGYLNTAEEKRRMAEEAAELAGSLGADGAICTTFSSGNSHTDTMLTAQACERLGIRTTVIVAETNGGLTDHVPEADSIVSVGNEDELVPAWRPQRVIGGERLRDGTPADRAGPIAAVHYLGALSESGDSSLQAVPA
jgi:sarcosine reductase